MYDAIMAFATATLTFNSIIGICLYWIPLLLCIIVYTSRSCKEITIDVRKRREYKDDTTGYAYYEPTIMVGTLLWRFIITLCPVVNFIVFIFDVFPTLFKNVFKSIGTVLTTPIIYSSSYTKDNRPDTKHNT